MIFFTYYNSLNHPEFMLVYGTKFWLCSPDNKSPFPLGHTRFFHIKIKNNTHIVDLMFVVRGHKLTWSGCMLFWSSMIYVIKHCSYSPKQFPSVHSFILDIKVCPELVPPIHGSRAYLVFLFNSLCLWSSFFLSDLWLCVKLFHPPFIFSLLLLSHLGEILWCFCM